MTKVDEDVMRAMRERYAEQTRGMFQDAPAYDPAAIVRDMVRHEQWRRHLVALHESGTAADGQDRCREHFDRGPTHAEQHGHVLYADSVCSWCEENER